VLGRRSGDAAVGRPLSPALDGGGAGPRARDPRWARRQWPCPHTGQVTSPNSGSTPSSPPCIDLDRGGSGGGLTAVTAEAVTAGRTTPSPFRAGATRPSPRDAGAGRDRSQDGALPPLHTRTIASSPKAPLRPSIRSACTPCAACAHTACGSAWPCCHRRPWPHPRHARTAPARCGRGLTGKG